jgi:transposase-like protein
MRVHANAPLGPKGRLTMVRRVVEQGWSLARAAAAAGVSERTCAKWVRRYRVEGEAGLLDRSSVPLSVPHRTPEDRVEAIAALRRLRMTAAEIAMTLGMPLSTVSAVLARIGLGKLSRLEPPEPPNRYERARPGELLHVDVKKLGVISGAGHRVTGRRESQNANRRARRRGAAKGWEFVHVCVDDATRLAYAEVLADEQGATAAGFLRRAVAFYAAHGITRRARAERQRRLLSLNDPRLRLPAARPQTPAHPPVPATHQRKGRAIHSAHCSAAGPTARSTAPAKNAPPRLTAGSGPTTIAAYTAPSATSRPSLASTS